MALSGTLKDFGLADILQLIGIQRKTGILSLNNDAERVQLKFLEGNVVGVTSGGKDAQELLGTVLVKTGKITEAQLSQALETQRRTLRRLGHILVKRGWITQEELVEALRMQSLQVIFRLFRWRDGTYSVQMVEDLDYDEQHATPISSETILMEGARMVDEWPIIERRVRSEKVVFEKTAAAAELAMGDVPPSLLDTDADLDFVFDSTARESEEPEPEEAPLSLSEGERTLLALVDGERSVGTIAEMSSLGEFDTYRIMADLVSRDLLREVDRVQRATEVRAERPWVGRAVGAACALALVTILGFSLATLRVNAFTPWRTLERGELEGLRGYASMSRLERVDEAIRVYFLQTGVFPGDLHDLEGAYLRPEDLLDPWGGGYGYLIDGEGYRVFARNADGDPDPASTLTHRFSPTQRMMIEGAGAPTP